MKPKKVLKIVGWIFLVAGITYLSLVGYSYYEFTYSYIPKGDQFTKRVGYIDPEKSLLSDGFETCGDYIYDYYNGGDDRTKYIKDKNGLRDFILDNYENKNYTDSGYLNIRFVVNCEGEAGRYVIIENSLELEPAAFSKDLRSQLFELTTQLSEWKPLVINNEPKDSYMYLSYRIENGEITQIIP